MAPQHFARRVQAIGIAVTAVWSAVCTYLLVKLLDHTVGARVSLEEERKGLELAIAAAERVRTGLIAGEKRLRTRGPRSRIVADPSYSAKNHIARVKAGGLLRRDRWFESGRLQQRVLIRTRLSEAVRTGRSHALVPATRRCHALRLRGDGQGGYVAGRISHR
jgi:hypothetical protein